MNVTSCSGDTFNTLFTRNQVLTSEYISCAFREDIMGIPSNSTYLRIAPQLSVLDCMSIVSATFQILPVYFINVGHARLSRRSRSFFHIIKYCCGHFIRVKPSLSLPCESGDKVSDNERLPTLWLERVSVYSLSLFQIPLSLIPN